MKKLFLAMAVAFILVSCDDKPMEETNNPFIGTWEFEGDIFRFNYSSLTKIKN
jgi:hypothetical protein